MMMNCQQGSSNRCVGIADWCNVVVGVTGSTFIPGTRVPCRHVVGRSADGFNVRVSLLSRNIACQRCSRGSSVWTQPKGVLFDSDHVHVYTLSEQIYQALPVNTVVEVYHRPIALHTVLLLCCVLFVVVVFYFILCIFGAFAGNFFAVPGTFWYRVRRSACACSVAPSQVARDNAVRNGRIL